MQIDAVLTRNQGHIFQVENFRCPHRDKPFHLRVNECLQLGDVLCRREWRPLILKTTCPLSG